MSKQKKIYKTIITIEVLSEEPIPSDMQVEDVIYEGNEGDYSIFVSEGKPKELIGYDAVKAIHKQGSDTDFFGMDEEGNEIMDWLS